MQEQVREKKIVAATSVVAAVFLTGGKLTVGLLTGSLGILAEAAHSALDLVASAITFFAVRISDRPADESHLYGHGKVENLSALAETQLLLITCVWIIYEAMQRLFFVSVKVDASLWAFLIMAISIAVDFSRSRALSRVAKKYKSQALEADALHFRTDIWSSAVVIAGLALVRFGEHLAFLVSPSATASASGSTSTRPSSQSQPRRTISVTSAPVNMALPAPMRMIFSRIVSLHAVECRRSPDVFGPASSIRTQQVIMESGMPSGVRCVRNGPITVRLCHSSPCEWRRGEVNSADCREAPGRLP